MLAAPAAVRGSRNLPGQAVLASVAIPLASVCLFTTASPER
jgi:hypothetical protein